VHNPEGPAIEDLDSLPWVSKVYRRDLDITRYNVPVPAQPVHLLLHLARLSGALHFLSVAPYALWASLAPAFFGRCRQRSPLRARTVSQRQGDLLSRRHLQLPQRAHDRAVQQAEAAQLHLELHLARHHRLRHPEGDEGSRLPPADRGLRIG